MPLSSITAKAPGKVILFGEHAINRGQPALAASVGLYASCRVTPVTAGYYFIGGGHTQHVTRSEVALVSRCIEDCCIAGDYAGLQAAASDDYFAPAKFVLTSVFGDDLPPGLSLEWQSDLPGASGMGSGGAAFTALVASLSALRTVPASEAILASEAINASQAQRAAWAHRGDIVAHGGMASALDTQTSLLGGVICYTGVGLAETIACAPGLTLVIGHSGVTASTREVNGRVRHWLSEKPTARMAPFRGIGALARAALPALAAGDWDELGRLMTLNQLALEKIGVSCPKLETLIDAALEAGALGAKVSGSGGGGIMVALTQPETKQAVAEAVTAVSGTVYLPEIGVAGATIQQQKETP